MVSGEKTKRRGISLLLLGPAAITAAALFGLHGGPYVAVAGCAIVVAVIGAGFVVVSRRQP